MRLPGTCSGCGKRVELAFGRRATGRHYFPKSYPDLPVAWCDRGTDRTHECRKAAA